MAQRGTPEAGPKFPNEAAVFSNGRTGRKRAIGLIDIRTKREHAFEPRTSLEATMPAEPANPPATGADLLEAATDQAITACGGNARDAVKALIVANEYLEAEVCDLMQAVSHAYARGRFQTYSG
jgi:stage V sporulation protein SpoVS